MRRALVPAGLALLLATGCGAADRLTGDLPAGSTDRVEVVVKPQGPQGKTVRSSLKCTAFTAKCKKLRAADFSDGGSKVCAQIYGGPAVATVTGRADSRAIQAEFSLTNSCEIDRWRRFAWLLGPPPG